jgi:hypothetical protein
MISWFYQNHVTKKHKPHYLLSGVDRRANMEVKVPDTTKFNGKLNNVSLHSLNKKKVIKTELNIIISDLLKLCTDLENRIQQFYKNHNLILMDWTARRDIHVMIKPEDYDK